MYSKTPTVLFICADNSILSPLAAAWLYRLSGQKLRASTAGISPAAIPAPVQQRVSALMRQPVALKPVALNRLSGKCFDVVITLADKSKPALPSHPYDDEHIVWDFRSPQSAAEIRQFEFELMERLVLWLEVNRLRAA